MSQAAKQCREYIEATYPGVRISRKSCRDTASGFISQHSAYGGPEPYDSNALDILGPEELDYEAERAFVQKIVTDLNSDLAAWSGRKILWNVPLHYGHAHIDFYPMCEERIWCARPVEPVWRYSDGSTIKTDDPEPENGAYEGVNVYEQFVEGIVTGWAEDVPKTRQEFERLYDIGALEGPAGKEATVAYWVGMLATPDDPSWLGFYARTELSVWGK